MTMKNIILLFASISLFLLGSCDKDAECQEQKEIPLTSLEEEYGCTNTRYGLDVELVDDYTIIRSQAGFGNIVSTSNCNPAIDFSKYDLLIGKRRLANGNSSIDYALARVCPSLNLN